MHPGKDLPQEPQVLPRPRVHASLLSDLGTSLLSQLGVVAGNLITLRLAAHFMEPAEVGEFALVRRVLVSLSPLLLLGLGVGLPRSLGRNAQDSRHATGIALSGWILGLPLTMAIAALLCAFPEPVAVMLFGSTSSHHLIRPLALLLVGNQLYLLSYAVLRGYLRIRRANVLQTIQVAILPCIVMAVLGGRGVGASLTGIGVSWILLSGIWAWPLLRESLRSVHGPSLRLATRELASYGLPRMPGDLAVASLYALGPVLAAHVLDMRSAGMLAIGMNLVTVLSAAFGPLGLVLLPRLSRALAGRGEAALRARLPLCMGLSLYGSSLLVILGCFYGNDWLRWVIGPRFTLEPTGLILLVLAAGGNVLFVVLRSLLDAAYFRPVNAIHAFIALAVLLGTWALSRDLFSGSAFVAICAATAASFSTLAALTLVAIMRRFSLRPDAAALTRWFLVHALTLGACAGTTRLIGSGSFLPFVFAHSLVLCLWFGSMRLFRVGWPRDLRDFVVRGRRGPVATPPPIRPRLPGPSRAQDAVSTIAAGEPEELQIQILE